MPERTSLALTSGRAPSCTRTASHSAGTAHNPAYVLLCRLAPPGTTSTGLCVQQRATARATSASHSRSVTTTIAAISSIAANVRTGHVTIGSPAISTSCLGRPKRVPRPAATMTAHHVCAERGMSAHVPLGFGEDHPASDRLQHAGHDDVRFLTDEPAAVLDHDHGAVVEIADTLVRLLAVTNDLHVQLFSGKHDGFNGIGEFIDVEDCDALHVRDAVEVVIVREQFASEILCQPDQLGIRAPNIRVVALAHFERAGLLQTFEHFQPAASARPFHGVGRIGDRLQLPEDKT